MSAVVTWTKISSRYVITLFLRISGLKMLLMNKEKAAGPIEMPWKRRLKQ